MPRTDDPPFQLRECVGGPYHGERMLFPESWVRTARAHPLGHVVTAGGRYVPGEREGRLVFFWIQVVDGGEDVTGYTPEPA